MPIISKKEASDLEWESTSKTLSGVKLHNLKTDPEIFAANWTFTMRCNIRNNDRDFQENEIVQLWETEWSAKEMEEDDMPLQLTGRSLYFQIIHVLRGPVYGLNEGWCILTFSPFPLELQL